ncbi:MAG: hypothetical protein ACOC8L_05455 [Spirochaetota bacterium]
MVRRWKLTWIALAASTVLIASCAMPAFDLQLILAHEARSKMKEIVVIPGVDANFGNVSSAQEFFYVPSRMMSADHGLLVHRNVLGYETKYVRYDTAAQSYRSDGRYDWRFFNDEPENQYPVILPTVETVGAYADLYFVAMPKSDEVDMEHTGYAYDATSVSFVETEPSTTETETLAIALDITGNGPTPNLRLLRKLSSGGVEVEGNAFLDGEFDWGGGYTTYGSVTLPGGAKPQGGQLAYQSSTDTYIYSFASGGDSFDVYRWEGPNAPAKLSASRRIDEILENGDLYSRGESTDVIYDGNGNVKHEINVGALHFAYERIDPTGSVLVYTLVYRDEGDGARVSIAVYEIALSEIGALE